MRLGEFWKVVSGRSVLVYGDFIDPFCYVGYHNVRAAAEAKGIALEWRGFELNPGTPPEGLPLATAENSDLRPGMWASVRGYAAGAGLELQEPRSIPCTRPALLLVETASRREVKNPLIERIYQAYFMRQQDIGREDVLIELAKEFDLPADQVRRTLADQNLAGKIEARRQEAERRLFPGMPGFVYRGQNYFGALSRQAWDAILSGQAVPGKIPGGTLRGR